MSQPRRGHTLIEMLVSMSLISVALTAVALTLHALYGVDRRFRDGMATEAGLDLLTLALRQDAHYARGAKLATDGSGRATALVLSLPAEQVITYTLTPRGIERVASHAGQESRESYHVDSSAAVWEIQEERTPARVTLRLLPTERTSRASNLRREIGIVVAVGLIRPPVIAAAPSGENQETTEPSAGESP